MQQSTLIIVTAIGLWLVGGLITDQTPGWVSAAFGIVSFLAIAGLVAFLMTRGTGWYALARKYPQRTPYTGQWHRIRTFQMAANLADNAGTRFSGGIVSVAATRDHLYIAAPSIVRFLFPTIQLPWTALASAKRFEAPGWVKPVVRDPGTLFQVQYDPGYTGEFVELETTAPETRIRLPMYAVEEGRSHLRLS